MAAPRSAGDATLVVDNGAIFGSPTVDTPIRLSVRRGGLPLCILKVTGNTSNILTVAEAIEGTTDQDQEVGDACWNAVTAGDLDDLGTAIDSGLTYTNPDPTPQPLGGIPAGMTFDSLPMQALLNDLLYPFQYPIFASFAIQGQASPVEVGTTIPSGVWTFIWSDTHPENVALNSVAISDVTGGQTLSMGLPDLGHAQVTVLSPVRLTDAGQYTWGIAARNSLGDAFSTTFTVAWHWRAHWGSSAAHTLDAAGILGLQTSGLSTGYSGTYSTPADHFKYLCYPDEFGGISNIVDTLTGFGVSMATVEDDPFYGQSQNDFDYGVVSVTNGQGATTNYRVLRSKNAFGAALQMGVS